jgi:hypothetical protein
LHRQGRSWAEVGAFVGQRKLSITADTYTHVSSSTTEKSTTRRSSPKKL